MSLEERYDTINNLVVKIFKIIENNEKNEKLYRYKLNELTNNFNDKKQHYTDEVRKSERYEREYMFLLEQYNLSRFVLEYKIKEINMYTQRLEMFRSHLQNRKSKKALDINHSFYGFNSSIQKELISKYDSKIRILRQRKLLSDTFEKYLLVLKERYPAIYHEKKNFSIPEDDLIALNEQKEMLLEEELVVKMELAKRFDKLSDNTVVSMDLANPDVMVVAQKLYPNLREKLLELNESRKINIQTENKKQAM